MRAVEEVKPVAQPSFFSRIFGWLKPAETEQPAAKPAAAVPRSPSQPRRDRNGNRPGGKDGSRRERPEGGNKPRRDDAAPRTERPAQAAPKAQEPRGERPPRPPRPPRVENEKTPALESASPIAASTPEQAEGSGNREGGRKRGRRGGRREREHREQQAGAATGEQLAIATTDEMETARHSEVKEQPAIQAAEQRHTEQQPPATERQAEPVAQFVQVAHAPAQAAEQRHTEPQPPATERQAEPVAQFVQVAHAPVQAVEQHHTEQQQAPVAERQAEPVTQFMQAVPIPPQVGEALISSGLVQIETDPAKRAAITMVAQPGETIPPAPRRRPRQREVYNMESSEPLVQIETQSPN